jgi:hypothetical protein
VTTRMDRRHGVDGDSQPGQRFAGQRPMSYTAASQEGVETVAYPEQCSPRERRRGGSDAAKRLIIALCVALAVTVAVALTLRASSGRHAPLGPARSGAASQGSESVAAGGQGVRHALTASRPSGPGRLDHAARAVSTGVPAPQPPLTGTKTGVSSATAGLGAFVASPKVGRCSCLSSPSQPRTSAPPPVYDPPPRTQTVASPPTPTTATAPAAPQAPPCTTTTTNSSESGGDATTTTSSSSSSSVTSCTFSCTGQRRRGGQ